MPRLRQSQSQTRGWRLRYADFTAPAHPADRQLVAMGTETREGDGESGGSGFLQERLWIVLLPAFLIATIVGASWLALLQQHHEEVRQIAETEARLKRAVRTVATDIAHAVETRQSRIYQSMIDMLARAYGGRATLHSVDGLTIAQAFASRAPAPSLDTGDSVHADHARELMVWGQVMGSGSRLGELRLHVAMPDPPPFPWPYWGSVLAVLTGIGAFILWLVTRVLAPLPGLGRLFRELGCRDPDTIEVPAERFAEFGQLRQEIVACVDGLRDRQRKAAESFVEVAFSLAREYEYHREGSIGHGQRTRRYAAWIAERLRMPPHQRDSLDVAALCHDIGRLPADAARTLGTTTDFDRMHPVIGAAFFEAMPGLEEVARLIYSHHENYDGTGFPDSLVGEAIPVGSRVLRIADGFDRLFNDNEDRSGLQAALDEMEESKGKLYDPYLFDLFREEVAVHMLERRRLRVTLKAYQAGMASQEESEVDA
jgi:HD-GYP domain-containing protein (c-di-GMP phosphodiesterase class II)